MFLSIKKVPKTYWSSEKPFNIKPKFSTLFFLCFGLSLFGLGEGLLIVSFTGASPWSVLAQGISLNIDFSIGTITLFVSIGVLLLWIPLKQKPGIGTILNAIIIASTIDLTLPYLPQPNDTYLKLLQACIGIFVVGLGSGIYLISNLGPGPRDGLMIGLQKQTGTSIPLIRTILELSAVISGWFLGGVVGIGTVLFVFGIGPCVGIGLTLVEKISKKP